MALLVVMYTPSTEWLARPLLVFADAQASDAIVVMGAWASIDGELNESGLKRSLHGADLFRSGLAGTVVLTGSSVSEEGGPSYLRPMADLLRLAGVPGDALIIESHSTNTHESAIRVAAVARARHWHRVALVTDAIHMRRSKLSFEKQGLEVAPAPTLMWDLGGGQPSIRVRKFGAILHEYGGLTYYWWRGWI